MKENSRATINVAQLLAPILSSRDMTDRLKEAIRKAEAKSVDLDFAEVEFLSRSAAHALLTLQEDFQRKCLNSKDISFINVNKDIKEMLRVVAANRAMPKESKPHFEAKKISIDSLKNIPA